MTKTEAAIRWMEEKANDPAVGYDQIHRWGSRGDFDCSSAVITAWEAAGVPVKTNGATYTGNMLQVFLKCGFSDVTKSINLKTGAGLIRGDVLLNTRHHTAMYCGEGLEVEASINELGKATGGQPGDQTGKEFLVRSYRNYPWQKILRYTAEKAVTAPGTLLQRGDMGTAVKKMQEMLILCGYSCGSNGADGYFGMETYGALLTFQKENGLIADGIYGSQSEGALTTLFGKKAASKADEEIDKVAREVLAGTWGNGAERRRKLTEAGYDYAAVQKRVNELV